MSARSVAAELNARQVETPSGAPWSAKTVIRARAVGGLGEAEKQSVMVFAMSNPAMVLRRANYHALQLLV